MGGTFHPFHIGHEALLRRAFELGSEVFVGISTGDLAHRGDRDVPAWERRADEVRAFADGAGFSGRLEVGRLETPEGPAATGDYDAIVVSPETTGGAEAINVAREKDGLRPLEVHVVPYALGADLLPLHATQLARGDLDRAGRRLTPVRVAVGSQNPVKVAAVEAAMADALRLPIEVRGLAVESGVPEQPKEAETMQGARTRCEAAMASWAEADYAVAVEAGLNQDPDAQAWYDVQACAVVDREGNMTDGWGPAFRYPDWVTERALQGEMISDILGPVADDPRIGGTTGAIGFLTDGRMDRTELTRIAVLMAMVPRLRSDLYHD